MSSITGVINLHKKKMKTIRNTREYFSINRSNLRDLYPKREKSIFEPSRGGMGMRLNSARTILIRTMTEERAMNPSPPNPVAEEIRIKIPKKIAIAKFVRIPAAETHSVPIRRSSDLKLFGLYGTGFAQPIINGAWVTIRKSGKIIEPYRSICFRGFRVSLPSYSAVWSPYASAA